MSKGELIGVVTVTYNSAGVLPAFLRCLFGQDHASFILFAVDSASSDNSVEVLRQFRNPRLHIIQNTKNVGIAEGNNLGIRAAFAAGCQSILLLNNDTEFGPNLLSLLLEGLEKYRADITCPKMLYMHDPTLIWAAGGCLQPLLGYRSKHYGALKRDDGKYDRVREITFVPGCCLLIKRQLLEKIGLIDPAYFVYVEDVDFMYRALRAGAKTIYLPDAKLLHKVGGSTGGGKTEFAVRYCTRNRVFYLLKHFGYAKSLSWIVIYQGYLWARLFLKFDTWRFFKIRQRAFAEGYRMYSELRDRVGKGEIAALSQR